MIQEIFDLIRDSLIDEVHYAIRINCDRVAAARLRILARMEADHTGKEYNEILDNYRQQYSSIRSYI